MKTIREHLETLPEPYRSQALKQTPEYRLNEETTSVKSAIANAFSWMKSEEGRSYWDSLFTMLNRGQVELKAPSKPKADSDTHPEHYSNQAIEPVEYIVKNGLGFCEGNVIKYVTRHAEKNGAEDIRKAMRYLEMILENQYNETS